MAVRAYPEKMNISIHAPPRGATTSTRKRSTISLFQFTPLREGRRGTRRTSPGTADISIHAPPRGATEDSVIRLRREYLISIHAPPRGATSAVSALVYAS